jgi:hypothetical protein
LVKKEMKCVYFMLLQSMEMGREVLLSTQHIFKGLGGNRLKDSDYFLWLLKIISPPPLCPPQYHPTLLPKGEERISQADV